MHAHTLIFTTNRLGVPELENIQDIKNLINEGLAMVEYFGHEIDNQADFIDDDMKLVSETISYIEFFFETNFEIDYDEIDEQRIDSFIISQIDNSQEVVIDYDGKDIKIYLHGLIN